MSVLIKGMEMPTSCEDCPMCHSNAEYDYAYCCVSSAETSGNKIPSDCPIVPVPPHGRLIDADAVMNSVTDEKGVYVSQFAAVIGEAVDAAPTIIPAEEGK